jgi:hypothetical protein
MALSEHAKRLVWPHFPTRQVLVCGQYWIKSYQSGEFFDMRTRIGLYSRAPAWYPPNMEHTDRNYINIHSIAKTSPLMITQVLGCLSFKWPVVTRSWRARAGSITTWLNLQSILCNNPKRWRLPMMTSISVVWVFDFVNNPWFRSIERSKRGESWYIANLTTNSLKP